MKAWSENSIAAESPPVFYSATFDVDGDGSTDPALLDTFLGVPNGVKGVWVNGSNLGRH